MDKIDIAIILCFAFTTLALIGALIDLELSDNSFLTSGIRYFS